MTFLNHETRETHEKKFKFLIPFSCVSRVSWFKNAISAFCILHSALIFAADPLETVVADLIEAQDKIEVARKDVEGLSQEIRTLTEKRAVADARVQASSRANQEALEALAFAELLVSNAWTRVPLSIRSSVKGKASDESPSPESRIAALRRSFSELQKYHAQILFGQDFVPGGRSSSNAAASITDYPNRLLCNILTLGLSTAIALSEDGTFAAMAIPADDETWEWTSAPDRLPEIRAAISATQKHFALVHFPIP